MFSTSIAWHDIFDILLITLLFYNVILVVKQTRAVTAIYGILTLIVGYFVVRLLGLTTVTWMLENILNSLFLLIVIVFQNDIRRGLSSLGTKKWWSGFLRKTNQESMDCDEICSAAEYMAKRKIGALIVIEGKVSLGEIIASGVPMDAKLTKELLINCFWPNSPLHDGAVILRHGRVSAAGCILPLSKVETKKRDYGTRHRAALGITEETDATVIVVSEERGVISVVEKGRMVSDLSGKTLLYEVRSILENF